MRPGTELSRFLRTFIYAVLRTLCTLFFQMESTRTDWLPGADCLEPSLLIGSIIDLSVTSLFETVFQSISGRHKREGEREKRYYLSPAHQ